MVSSVLCRKLASRWLELDDMCTQLINTGGQLLKIGPCTTANSDRAPCIPPRGRRIGSIVVVDSSL